MLRVRLQGELRVEIEGRPLGSIASGRARALLGWLALHPGRHARTRVAAVFWPDVLDSSSRASLRTTLATLRRELGEAGDYLAADRERVSLDGPGLWVDVREIDRLAGEGRRAEAVELCSDAPLLADLDDDWVLEAREDHRDRVGGLLAALGEEAESAGDHDAAVAYARRRLELDPLSEDAARVVMRRLAAGGDPAAAVAAYEAFARALRRELGMAPSGETRELAAGLRADDRPAALDLPLPPAFAHGSHAPLAGRAEPLSRLLAAWRAASAGPASMAAVEGEPGTGKTRLLAELAAEVQRGGGLVLAGRCRDDDAGVFAPFTEALRPYVARAGEELPAWIARELARLLPELDPDAAGPEGAPQDARQRLFEAVAATVGQATGRAPVLLVVEDLHWADAATVGLLAHVLATLRSERLLVAGSLRDQDGTANAPLNDLLVDLRAERRLDRIALAGLSEEETGTLAGAWLGEPAAPALATALRRRTGGNPLFVEELVRHLVESRPGRTADELLAAAAAEVPEGVRAVIERRLARLSEPAARAVRTAAVSGEDFEFADLAAACDLEDEPLMDALGEATGAGLVDEDARPGRFRFAHALIREAVLAGLGGTRRALLHRRLAEELEARGGREGRPQELARHLLGARPLVEASEAARAALNAAGRSIRALAYEDAAELLGEALDGELADPDPLRAELLLGLADARARLGDAPAAAAALEQAVGQARALGDGELLARAALASAGLTVSIAPVRDEVRELLEAALDAVADDSELRPRLLARLAIELYYAPPAEQRERLSAEALAIGRRSGGRALIEALVARHVGLWSPAHTEERLEIADELIAAARDGGDREGELQGVNWRIADLFELGELDAVRSSIEDHERLSDELRLPGFAWYVPLWRASIALLEFRLEDASRLRAEGERIGRAAHDENAELLFEVQGRGIDGATGGFTHEDVVAMQRRAESSAAGGAWRIAVLARRLILDGPEGVRDDAEREVAALVASQLDTNWLYAATGIGLVVSHLEDRRAAERLYPLIAPYAERVVTVGRACVCTGSAHLSLGMLALTIGERETAVAHLEQAIRRNDALGAVAYGITARRALASVLGDDGEQLRRQADEAADRVGMADLSGVLWTV